MNVPDGTTNVDPWLSPAAVELSPDDPDAQPRRPAARPQNFDDLGIDLLSAIATELPAAASGDLTAIATIRSAGQALVSYRTAPRPIWNADGVLIERYQEAKTALTQRETQR